METVMTDFETNVKEWDLSPDDWDEKHFPVKMKINLIAWLKAPFPAVVF